MIPGINIPKVTPIIFTNKKLIVGLKFIYTVNNINKNPPNSIGLNFIINPVINKVVLNKNKISGTGLFTPFKSEIITSKNQDTLKTPQIIFMTLLRWVSYPIFFLFLIF